MGLGKNQCCDQDQINANIKQLEDEGFKKIEVDGEEMWVRPTTMQQDLIDAVRVAVNNGKVATSV